jgi:hypothetical protein
MLNGLAVHVAMPVAEGHAEHMYLGVTMKLGSGANLVMNPISPGRLLLKVRETLGRASGKKTQEYM